MRTQVLSATIALGLLLSSGGCRKSATSFRRSPQELDQLEKAPSRTIAQVPASHEATDKNNLRANDLVHGDGSQRLSVIRRWSGAGTTNTLFGKGWADENVFRLTQIDAGTVLLWRGGLGWRTAHGAKGKFTSATGETIERAGAGWNYRSKSGATLNFDESGKLISETSAFGVTRNYSYDAGGRLTAVGDSAQNSLRYTYDKEGRVTQIEGPEGLRSVYRYDDKGLLIGVTNSANVQIEYRYDNSGELASVKDQFGRQTEVAKLPALAPASDTSNSPPSRDVERDERGAVKTAVIGGDKIAFRYDKQGALESLDSPAGPTGYKHDAFGRLIEVIQPGGGTTRFEYNSLGLATLVAAADGSSERLTYNKYGMPVRRERSASDWEEFVYDINGRMVIRRSAPDGEEKFVYDDQDRLVGRKTAAGAEVTYVYDARGSLLTETWSSGEKISRAYNANGQLVEAVSASGLRTQFVYGEKGELIEFSDPLHGKTRYSDSPSGRTIEREGIGKFTAQFDADGKPVSLLTPAGQQTSFLRNPAGALTASIGPDRVMMKYAYDAEQRLASITSPGGAKITLKRDGAGRITEILRGDIRWREFRYDSNGRMVEALSPLGSAAKRGYGKNGMLEKITGPDGELAVTESEDGNRKTLKGKAGEWEEEFAKDGALTRRNYKLAGLDLKLPRDPHGRPVAIELNALRVEYVYDASGQLASVTLPGNKAVAITRDDAGRVTKLDLASIAGVELKYDRADRVTSVTARNAKGAELFAESYSFDPAGNVAEIKSAAVSQKLEYDNTDRLKKITGTKAAQEFRYDVGGNLTGAGSARWRLDQLGRPLQQGPTSFTWDAAGNLVRSENGLSRTDNTFDAAGRLVQRKRDTLKWTYGYLPNGDRVWKEGPKGKIWFAYLDEALAGLKDENGTSWLVVNLPGTDWPLALCGSNGKTYFAVADRLHSTRRFIDESGAVVATTDFGAFGNVAQESGEAPLALYAGMVRDEGGLFYARQRYYDPAIARFTSMDPTVGTVGVPASHQAYAYAANNPLRYRDPKGAEPTAAPDSADSGGELFSTYNILTGQYIFDSRLWSMIGGYVVDQTVSAVRETISIVTSPEMPDALAIGVGMALAPSPVSTVVKIGLGAGAAGTAAETVVMQTTAVSSGVLQTIARFVGPAGAYAAGAWGALQIYRLANEAYGLNNAGNEVKGSEGAAKALQNSIENKLVEALKNDPSKFLPGPNGRKLDPNKPEDIAEILARVHSNIAENRKPYEGILTSDPTREQQLREALKRAEQLLKEGWEIGSQGRSLLEGAEGYEKAAQENLQKALKIAGARALLESDLSGLPLAGEEVKRLMAAVKKEAKDLRAAEGEMRAAIAVCESAAKQVCDWSQQSPTATAEQAKTWSAEGGSLIFQASNQLNAVQEKTDRVGTAREELSRALAVLEGYRAQVDAMRFGEGLAGAAGIDVQSALQSAKDAAEVAKQSRTTAQRMKGELEKIPPQVRTVLAPVSWSAECATPLARAETLLEFMPDSLPFNFGVLLNTALPVLDAFLANLKRAETAIKAVDIDGLTSAANSANADAEAAWNSASALASSPDRYRALQKASRCLAEITAKANATAASSPSPLPSSSAKPTDDMVTVPNLAVFETREEMKLALKHAGLVATFVGTQKKTPSKEMEYKVAGQDPLPDTKVKRGKVVTIAVYAKHDPAGEQTASPSPSSPTPSGNDEEVIVPDLSNYTTSEMEAVLTHAGMLKRKLVAAKDKTPSKEKEFKFASQSPAAGTKVKQREVVTVSLYPKFEDSEEKTTAAGTVPDVIGLEIRVAQAKIEAAGLKLVGVESGTLQPPTPDKAYRIYSQTPKAGEAAPPDKFVSVKEYGSGKASEPEPAPSVSLGAGNTDFEGQWAGTTGFSDSRGGMSVTFTIQRSANGYAITMSDNKTRQVFQRTRVEGDWLIGESDWDLAAALPGGVKGSGDLITAIYKFRREGDDLVVEGSAFNKPREGKYGKMETMGRMKRK